MQISSSKIAVDRTAGHGSFAGMEPSAQLVIVETLFATTATKRTSYVLVLPTVDAASDPTGTSGAPFPVPSDLALILAAKILCDDVAVEFVTSKHNDGADAFHVIREGVLLESKEVMERDPDADTSVAQVWFVGEA